MMLLIKPFKHISVDSALPHKIITLSYLVENTFEEVLSQLISNNLKSANITSEDLFENKAAELNKGITEISLKAIKDLRIPFGFKILKRKNRINNGGGEILAAVIRYLNFGNTMQNIYNDITLIKSNINRAL